MSLIKEDKIQYMVHSFRTESVVFRGTEQQCLEYIKENDTLDFPLELYWAKEGEKHYIENKNELEEDEVELW